MSFDYLKNRLASLTQANFIDFVFRLWDIDSLDTEREIKFVNNLPGMGLGVFEQSNIKLDSNRSKESQAFSLIIPFFKPFELFLSSSNLYISFKDEKAVVGKYLKVLNERTNTWFFPQDGHFLGSNILFVSNYHDISKSIYFTSILPQLKKLVISKNIINDVGIGTVDSFVDRIPKKTEVVLKSVYSKYFNETSIVFKNDQFRVEQHLTEKYLESGVLPKSFSPCDTVISINPGVDSILVQEFEYLLNKGFKEKELEFFIVKNYREIFGDKYDRVENQIWLKFPELDINNKNRSIDIFLRNAVEKDWELIELKGKTKIVTSYRDVPTLSSKIQGAISQLRNYGKILQQDSVKLRFLQEGIEYYEPELRLVIGGNPDIPLAHWRRIKNENEKGLKISTCSEIIEEMKLRQKGVCELINQNNIHIRQ